MDAIILAGGKSTRMEDELPKALIQVKGKPILAHQLDYTLGKVDKIVLSVGHKAGQVVDFIRENYPSAPIEFAIEMEPLGTAGGIRKAMLLTKSEWVLVLNCDDITDINLKTLEEIRENSVCVAHPMLPFGLITEKDGFGQFVEKPTLQEWVSCGWYIFNRQQLLEVLPEKGSIEYDVFPKIKFRLFKHEGFWNTLNTKKDVMEFEKVELPATFTQAS
ncbi:MAG: nucleotidyltransferase family protein [Patescibacteria group bacterium]